MLHLLPLLPRILFLSGRLTRDQRADRPIPEGQLGIGDDIGTTTNDVTLCQCQYVIPASYLLTQEHDKGLKEKSNSFKTQFT